MITKALTPKRPPYIVPMGVTISLICSIFSMAMSHSLRSVPSIRAIPDARMHIITYLRRTQNDPSLCKP